MDESCDLEGSMTPPSMDSPKVKEYTSNIPQYQGTNYSF